MSDTAEAVAALLPDPLTPDSPLWAWAAETIGERAREMLSHAEGVEAGEDIEAVHDMRVWSRRLVAAMRVFEPCFPAAEYRGLMREARRVTKRLGGVRDLDVLLDYFRNLREGAAPEELPGIDYLIAQRRREREQERKPMLRALAKVVESGFERRLGRFLRDQAEAFAVGLDPATIRYLRPSAYEARSGAVPPPSFARRSFREVAPELLAERYEELYHFEPYVRRPEAQTELHQMRIAAKWLRYTMELFAPAYSDGLKAQISAVKKLQELLGDLHDSDVRRWLLRDTLAAPLDADGLMDLGLLLPESVIAGLERLRAREEEVRARCYAAFLKEWKKLEKQRFAETCRKRIRQPDA